MVISVETIDNQIVVFGPIVDDLILVLLGST